MFKDRAHFLAVAATAMRRVLVDHARARQTHKRGRTCTLVEVEDLDSLPREDVELRFFGGLTTEETAAIVGISERTVKREWQISRAWLSRELKRTSGERRAGG
jgi:DNA-directed RNA polymerase specialized sigma24 family protein